MKKIVKISYNPYKMITKMSVNNVDVCSDACTDDKLLKFREFIEQETPLQTWIEPIQYRDWNGFVNELSSVDRNDEVRIEFSGRVIDFNDFKRSIKDQNEERPESKRVKYEFTHIKKLDDKVLSDNIEKVVQELNTDRFRKLVEERDSEVLKTTYREMNENYERARDNEFQIVLAGIYSSGKSTLINTLIRHNVLPTSSRTCTSKNCRIKHDKTLDMQQISLTCLDVNGKKLFATKIFDNDAECSAFFEEICPIDAVNENYKNVAIMEIGVNLSHLYPDGISDDKFTIVLIDTPGMDSAESSENGKNLHAETALEAITDKSKPMIILCVDADNYENKSIGEFMREIISQSQQDEDGFNDRFLFLMNKSDTITYKNNERAEEIKNDFADYLTNSDKWDIDSDETDLQKLADAASLFVPRVFMTAAFISLAIQENAIAYSKEELKDSFKRSLRTELKKFIENIIDFDDVNYFLSKYCDIPNYQKDIIDDEFKKYLIDGNTTKAVELQCGLVSVEMAIKDYIERYAYPIKVRALLDTFEDILDDVDCFTNGFLADIKNKEKEMGEKSVEREGVRKEKRNVKRKIDEIEKANKIICDQSVLLKRIEFDSDALDYAIGKFMADIYADKVVNEFVALDNSAFTRKSKYLLELEIKEKLEHLEKLFIVSVKKVNQKLEEIKAKHDIALKEIFNILTETIILLEKSEIFQQGNYNFKNSLAWKKDYNNLTFEKFMKNTLDEIKDQTIIETNWTKVNYSHSWNPFKRVKSWFMDDTISYKEYEYNPQKIGDAIASHTQLMREETDNMQKRFESELNIKKAEIQQMLQELSNRIKEFLHEIENQDSKIDEISIDIDKLKEEKNNCQLTIEWLNHLKLQIKGV